MIDTVPLNLFVQTILDDPNRSHKQRAKDAAREIEDWCRTHYAIPTDVRLEIPTEWEHRVPLLLESELEVLLAEDEMPEPVVVRGPADLLNQLEFSHGDVPVVKVEDVATVVFVPQNDPPGSWSGRVRGWWNR